MKTKLAVLFIFIFATSITFAQQMNRQKIKALKTAYLTEALDLKPKEAEKFWPVYNLYIGNIQQNKMQLEGGLQRKIKFAGGVENLSEKEAQKLIEISIQLEKEITASKIKLIKELSKVISAKKIIMLKKAERDFNRRILQEYGKRRRMDNYKKRAN
ncbi:MAG: sensor of ECF-type sigma factor [Lutibacter sp.]|uniref:sensor of ECF-type sigma factor n=1 Tax=Lutibacter sp. TaxID=1925666 RepID=UPI003859E6CA